LSKLKPESLGLLLLLATFVALGPLSTDMYLPAWPGMVSIFDTSLSRVQLTISTYLLGFSIFHLVCGPLSDRFGRRPVLLLGMLIFCLASIGCALSETIEQLIFWRFLQGVGACVGPTLGRAIVRDIYGPVKAAKALATLAAIMALAPAIAPIIGGWMLTFLPWPSIFWFLCVYAALAMLSLVLLLGETLPETQSLRPARILANYVELLKHRQYRLQVLGGASIYAGAFAFVSGASFVLIDFMGVAPSEFGYWFALNVLGYITGNLYVARYGSRYSKKQLTLLGSVLGCVSGLIMVAFCLAGIYHPLMIVLPVAVYTGGVGIAIPNAMAQALAPFPHMAGTASALLGFVQMAIASVSGLIVGLLLVDNPLPMVLTITGCGFLSLVFFIMAPEAIVEKTDT
jgi:DHA1 family bicyclomycin/chloramphenicol resistance-like MFS transporter